jgi:hypothetical protein
MTIPKMIGTINGTYKATAKIGRKAFAYNGTTLGLVVAAIAAGAKAGTIVRDDFNNKHRIVAAPHDSRAGGFWASKVAV